MPEQLPNILLLHAVLPLDIPILVGDGDVNRRYVAPLVEEGKRQFLFHRTESMHTVIS